MGGLWVDQEKRRKRGVCCPDSSGLQALCPQTAPGIRETGSISQAWLKLSEVFKLVPAAQKQFSTFPTNQAVDVHVSRCTSWAAVVIWT